MTRVTLARASPLPSASEGSEWLGRLRPRRDALWAEVGEAAVALNAMLRAHRAVTGDPYARDVRPEAALVVRVGHGTGEEVAGGRFTEAVEVPIRDRRARRIERLAPQEHLAAALSAKLPVLACEELVVRARADLDAARRREAALQARAALECALAELEGSAADGLPELHQPVAAAGAAALRGDPGAEHGAQVERAVAAMERALRRRRHRLFAGD